MRSLESRPVQAEILKLLNDFQLHLRCKWEGGTQEETGLLTRTEFTVLFVLVESHDFCFVIIDQQTGELAPALSKGNHSLKFDRVRRAEGKLINIGEASNRDGTRR